MKAMPVRSLSFRLQRKIYKNIDGVRDEKLWATTGNFNRTRDRGAVQICMDTYYMAI